MAYSANEALPMGTEVNGRYRIVAIVGQGGAGTVYKVTDVASGTTYALKELADPSSGARKQFENEAQWLKGLDHNSIPKVRESFAWEDRRYLVMDFVTGENLEQKLVRQGGRPLREAEVLAWTLPICDALQYLHSRMPPILHRDVKPANIIVTPDGHPVLVDLGIAKEHLPGAGQTATFVRKAGTEGYAPPEQYTTAGKTGPWSDVYGVGATLYELLTGAIPPTAIERVALDKAMPRPRTHNPEISQHVDMAVTRALAIRPSDRFQAVAELALALRGVAGTAGMAPQMRPAHGASPIPMVAGIHGAAMGAPLGGAPSGPTAARAASTPPTLPRTPSGPSRWSGLASPAPSSHASAPSGGLGALPNLDGPLLPAVPTPVLPPSSSSFGASGGSSPRWAAGGGAQAPISAGSVEGGRARGRAVSVAQVSVKVAGGDLTAAEARDEPRGDHRRRRVPSWLVIAVSVVVLLALAGGGVAVGVLGVLLPPDRTTPQATITGYFTALKAGDYARAWQYDAASHNDPSSQPNFLSSLKADDDHLGRVISLQVVTVDQDTAGTARAQVSVQRASAPGTPITYTVVLTQYGGAAWLIDSIASS